MASGSNLIHGLGPEMAHSAYFEDSVLMTPPFCAMESGELCVRERSNAAHMFRVAACVMIGDVLRRAAATTSGR